MNKEQNERITYEEFMTMFKFAPRMVYTLYNKAEDEIDQLTNNWNELEEWVEKQKDYYDKNDEYSNFRAYADELDDVLYKMKQIKGGNNEK